MAITAVSPDLISVAKQIFRQIGLDMKGQQALISAMQGKMGDLNALQTTEKTNLVGAINEAFASTNLIDDATTDTDTTWSSSKIAAQIQAGLASLIDGAPDALNTLNELAEALGDNPDVVQTILDTLGKVVRVDVAQDFTAAEKAQGRSNIGAASEADLTQFAANVGDIGSLVLADYTDYRDGDRV